MNDINEVIKKINDFEFSEKYEEAISLYYKFINKYPMELIKYCITKITLIKNKKHLNNYLEKIIIFIETLYNSKKDLKELIQKTQSDKFDKEIQNTIKEYEKKEKNYDLYIIFAYILVKTKTKESCRIDKYIVAAMERAKLFLPALTVINEIAVFDMDEITIRTLFRLSRKTENYEIIEDYIKKNPEIIHEPKFNVQYELVYYFNTTKNKKLLNNSLKLILLKAKTSIPISKTLYNFYLQFEMFEDAENLSKQIQVLENNEKHKISNEIVNETVNETDSIVSEKIKNLVNELESEQEHNRQMIALREILKGFSHEVGQPITAIIYEVQLYERKLKKGLIKENDIYTLLHKILEQTDRIGNLLARFKPILPGNRIDEKFSLYFCIGKVLKNYSARLDNENICYNIKVIKDDVIFGDIVQFEQVISNLIINSIHAIQKKRETNNFIGSIHVTITKKEQNTLVIFKDNGTGVDDSISKKIFEPFFSTKDKNKVDGGEGLGLFMIWNILKIFKASIKLDSSYKNGAKFIIEFSNKGVINE